MRLIATLALVTLTAVGCGRPETAMTTPPSFQAGQIWTFKSRAGQERLRVFILRVDQHPKLGEMVSIRVLESNDPLAIYIGHLPFASDALRKSLIAVVAHASVPSVLEGYDEWQTAMRERGAGVFTADLGETIEFLISQTGSATRPAG